MIREEMAAGGEGREWTRRSGLLRGAPAEVGERHEREKFSRLLRAGTYGSALGRKKQREGNQIDARCEAPGDPGEQASATCPKRG